MASISRRKSQRLSKAQRRQLKKQQARKARAARRQLRDHYDCLPSSARPLFQHLAGAFTRPTFVRFVVLTLAAILTLGGRTVCNLLRTLRALAPGHPSSYHRVFSKRRWSAWRLARLLAGWIFNRLLPDGPLHLAADDTVDEHPGKKVYGKGCHRDPVRSTHSFVAFRWGHKWVVLSVLVRFPFSRRRWALPVLVALYQSEEDNRQQGRRHKTPSQLVRQMLLVLMRWFPDRQFICSADGNYATHELARLGARHRKRLTFVSHFYPDANLYAPPPPYSGQGRPRVKGKKLPTPEEAVAATAGPPAKARNCPVPRR